VDVRFTAATNRDLLARVAQGAFRQDLLFRLNAVTITIPPLRERRDEIPALISAFASEAAARLGKPPPAVDPRAMAALDAYSWPGNVRELRHAIERAVFLFRAESITLEHLPAEIAVAPTSESAPRGAPTPGAPHIADERERILDALNRSAGHQGRAAELLGISRRTLSDKLDALDLPRPRKGQPPSKR
jgi:DNA-binding NtrC family response regulator